MQCQNEFTSASATIVKVNSAHSVNISQNAAASSVASTGSNFSWGHDDTTTLQSVATQVVSTTTAPASVVLPCGATTIRGAFIRRGISSANATQAFPIGISGCPSQGTIIVMTPDSSCSGQTDAPGCFFSDNYIGGNSYTQLGMGDRLSNLLITSLGFDNFVGSNFANNQAVIFIAGYSELDNVWVNGFAWNQSASPSNVTYGIQTYYYDSTSDLVWGGGTLINSGSWLGGDWACAFGGGGYTPTVVYSGYCGGTEFDAVTLAGANTVELNNMVLVNGDYTAGGYNQCTALWASGSAPSTGLRAFTGNFVDNGSLIYGSAYLYSGTLRFNNDTISNLAFGPACQQPRSFYNSGATVYAAGVNLTPVSNDPTALTLASGGFYAQSSNLSAPSGSTGIDMSGGVLYDQGGNTFSASTFSGGTVVPFANSSSNSLTVASRNTTLTGTALVASTTYPSNFTARIYASDSAAGAGCTGNTTIGWTVSYTDQTGHSQTSTATETITTNGNASGGDALKILLPITTNAGSAVNVSTSYSAGTGCTTNPSYSGLVTVQ